MIKKGRLKIKLPSAAVHLKGFMVDRAGDFHKTETVVWLFPALIALMHLYIKPFYLFSTGLAVMDKVAERISLFDIVFPFVFVRYAPSLVLPVLKKAAVVIPAAIYFMVIVILAIFHHHPLDVYYWLSQIYGLLIYLLFYGMATRLDGKNLRLFGRNVFSYFLVSACLAVILALLFKVNIIWTGGFYNSFLPLFKYRLQLLASDPNRLASYFLFIGLCSALYLNALSAEDRGKAYWVAGIVIILSLLVRGRVMPFIFILLLVPFYITVKDALEKKALFFGMAGSILLVVVGMLSTVVAVFPLQKAPPYLNLNTPSQYFALHSSYANIYLGENKMIGSGYVGSSRLYTKYVDEELENEAISSFNLPSEEKNGWLKRSKPPHNAYLRMLSAGGTLWLVAWLILVSAPVIFIFTEKRFFVNSAGVLIVLYFFSNILVAHFDDIIHYLWFWAGLGLMHGMATSHNFERHE